MHIDVTGEQGEKITSLKVFYDISEEKRMVVYTMPSGKTIRHLY